MSTTHGLTDGQQGSAIQPRIEAKTYPFRESARAAESPEFAEWGEMTSPPGSALDATAVDAAAPRRLGLRARFRTSGLEACGRLSACALRIAWLRATSPGEGRRGERETAAVRSLVSAAGELKGAFAKAGQFAALRHDVFSAEARAALESLQDRVPALPASVAIATIESEFGVAIDTLFERFDPEPLGAASIAQVHRATLHDGSEVAVKVQYPWIDAAMPGDLRLLRFVLRRVARGADDFERLFAEFADGLRGELDFRAEAAVAREIAANLQDMPSVVVPTIVESLTSKRVLTMSFHAGLRIDNREALVERGIAPERIVEIIAHAYARQIFTDGVFHADPHPGNLFVLENATEPAKPQVLFVDFGLSRRLSPELRTALREAIYAMLQRDRTTFVDRMDAMGMIGEGAREDVERGVGAMLDRIAGEGGALGLSSGQVLSIKDEAKRLLADTRGLQLPNDLLLYAKTMSYLFSLAGRLAPDIDVMKISVPYLLKFLASKDEA